MEFLEVFILVFSFLVLLTIGVPIAFSIGISGILTMLVSIDVIPALTTFSQRMATGLDSFALLAIPFFILAGNIMNRGDCHPADRFCPGAGWRNNRRSGNG